MVISSPRYTFAGKVGVTIALVVAFDRLFPVAIEGFSVGLFALAWLLGVIVARPGMRQARLDIRIAVSLAGVFCVALAYDPGPLAWVMFWAALSISTLLPRCDGFDDAWRWALRLIIHGTAGFARPVVDVVRVLGLRRRDKRPTFQSVAAVLALPLAGTALFGTLFAIANPVIEEMLGRIQLPSIEKFLEWAFATFLIWPALRPLAVVTRLRLPEPRANLLGASLPSVLIALCLFNALFAVQNGLDIAFLWSGAPLPPGMSMTEYVHRGAYPLIVTALLAGLFVLVTLRSGTPTAANKTIRLLVALWVAQNILLVASSVLRTIDYIVQYELTAWRIAALLWMALVATGLVLIVVRMWFGRSARWLINANAIAAAIVLAPCSLVDVQASAARWNVRHAREVGGRGQALDLCYLEGMGAPALLPLIEFERSHLTNPLRDRVREVRGAIFEALVQGQSHWWSWTPHGAIRLHRAQALLGPQPSGDSLRPSGVQPRCYAPIDPHGAATLTGEATR